VEDGGEGKKMSREAEEPRRDQSEKGEKEDQSEIRITSSDYPPGDRLRQERGERGGSRVASSGLTWVRANKEDRLVEELGRFRGRSFDVDESSRVEGCNGSTRLEGVSCNAQLKAEMVHRNQF